jgi:branched-chain amino acid transport system permease protein
MRFRVAALPYALIFAAAAAIPLAGDDYLVVIATRAAVYWVLVSGLNLVVGFAGQLAIGWVSLLTIGAYTTSIIVARDWLGPLPALAVAGVVGASAGVLVGLPALRLRPSISR